MNAGLSKTDPEQKTVVGQHGKSSNTGLLPIKGTFFHPVLYCVSFPRREGEGIAERGIFSFSSCTSYPLFLNAWESLGVPTSLLTSLHLAKGQRGGREKRFVRILETDTAVW